MQGREVPALPTFTFKDTGVTVAIRKVSPLLNIELRKSFPPPKPPMTSVDYGDGTRKTEPNPNDPAYLEAVQRYEIEFEERARKLHIRRGVELTLDEYQQTQVAELRQEMQEIGVALDADDNFVYICYIAVGTEDDFNELIDAITRRSHPTEEAVQEVVDTFPSTIQGA